MKMIVSAFSLLSAFSLAAPAQTTAPEANGQAMVQDLTYNPDEPVTAESVGWCVDMWGHTFPCAPLLPPPPPREEYYRRHRGYDGYSQRRYDPPPARESYTCSAQGRRGGPVTRWGSSEREAHDRAVVDCGGFNNRCVVINCNF